MGNWFSLGWVNQTQPRDPDSDSAAMGHVRIELEMLKAQIDSCKQQLEGVLHSGRTVDSATSKWFAMRIHQLQQTYAEVTNSISQWSAMQGQANKREVFRWARESHQKTPLLRENNNPSNGNHQAGDEQLA